MIPATEDGGEVVLATRRLPGGEGACARSVGDVQHILPCSGRLSVGRAAESDPSRCDRERGKEAPGAQQGWWLRGGCQTVAFSRGSGGQSSSPRNPRAAKWRNSVRSEERETRARVLLLCKPERRRRGLRMRWEFNRIFYYGDGHRLSQIE